ncbi:MAG: response regulator, partial [Candidatus Sericytochromatia bacterium]|nr:response regulator [Candidatus Sericytochromatia bacterium]
GQIIPRGGGETVLVVEDDPQLRTVLHRLLERHGYVSLQAATPSAAIELCTAYAGPIDLVISDVVMPERYGPDLAKDVAKLRPSVAFLFISGYTDARLRQLMRSEYTEDILEKPFSSATLAQKVREALGDRQQN